MREEPKVSANMKVERNGVSVPAGLASNPQLYQPANERASPSHSCCFARDRGAAKMRSRLQAIAAKWQLNDAHFLNFEKDPSDLDFDAER